MSQIVQARCPHCRNVLRIPALWLQQPMRCKHCKLVFQAKGAGSPAPAPQAASQRTAGIMAAPAVASSGNAFDFVNTAAAIPPQGRGRRRRRSRWPLAVVGLLVVVTAAAGLIFGPRLVALLHSADEPGHGAPPEQVAQGKPSPTDTEKPPVEPGEKPNPGETPNPPPKNNGNPGENPPKTPPEPGPMPKQPPDVQPPDMGEDPPPIKKPPTPPKKAWPQQYYPRRALAISVNDYLFANSLNYGDKLATKPGGKAIDYPGSSAREVLNAFGHFYMKFPTTQLFELSDGKRPGPGAPVKDPPPGQGDVVPLKPVIENAITQFLNTSRKQDHVIVFFSGHVTKDDNGDVYLVPAEGELDNPKTLVPLKWVYDQLKACSVRQKVLILDICRFNPSRGSERPGGDPLDEAIEKQLQSPPKGVQVWVSCSKEQQSIEFDKGSLFQEALCSAMWEKAMTASYPDEALPLDDLLKRVNEYLQSRLPSDTKQVSHLYGSAPASGADFNPDEPPAKKFSLVPPPPSGGIAGRAVVKSIINEINSIPPVRAGKEDPKTKFETFKGKLQFKALSPELERLVLDYPFPAKVLADYQVDGYSDESEFIDKEKEFPVRAYVMRAKEVMRDTASKFHMKEKFDGTSNAQVKAKIKNDQKDPALAEFLLREALENLVDAEKEIKLEPSKRWQAHYYFTRAQLKARAIYVVEYNTILGQIRLDDMPELPKGSLGYQVAARDKLSTPKKGALYVHEWHKQLGKEWQYIIDHYPNTPWAVLARREKDASLGLEWRPVKN